MSQSPHLSELTEELAKTIWEADYKFSNPRGYRVTRWEDVVVSASRQSARFVVAAILPIIRKAQAAAWSEGAAAASENIARAIWEDGSPIANPYEQEVEHDQQ